MMATLNNITTVSIALCTYNGERFLQQQLDSIASQTHLPDEVIVSDDASTDRTVEILEKWKENVPFTVKVYHHQPNGVNKNFEYVLSQCTKDVIFICDQDDIWEKEKIETLLKILDENPNIGAVYHDAVLIDENNKRISGITMAQYARYFMINGIPVYLNIDTKKNYNPSGCCSAIRRIFLEKIFPIPNSVIYDQWIFACLEAITEKKSISDCLIEHRMHNNNVSTSPDFIPDIVQKLQKSYIGSQWSSLSCPLYVNATPILEAIRKHIGSFPESKYKTQYLEFLDQTYKHIINRTRIQRNVVIFFPFLLREIFQRYGYFHFYLPIKTILYDCKLGLWNAINPVSILQEIKNMLSKIRK